MRSNTSLLIAAVVRVQTIAYQSKRMKGEESQNLVNLCQSRLKPRCDGDRGSICLPSTMTTLHETIIPSRRTRRITVLISGSGPFTPLSFPSPPPS